MKRALLLAAAALLAAPAVHAQSVAITNARLVIGDGSPPIDTMRKAAASTFTSGGVAGHRGSPGCGSGLGGVGAASRNHWAARSLYLMMPL